MAIVFTVLFFVGLVVVVRSVRWGRCCFWLVWMAVGAVMGTVFWLFATGTLRV